MIARIFATTAAVALAAPALAQTAPAAAPTDAAAPAASTDAGVMQGATVYDPQGGMVGTIESTTGTMAVVATQAHKVQLPTSSFAKGPKGPVIAMTAAQLDQAAAQATPSTTAKPTVTQGAQVSGPQGNPVGTVSEVDAQFATVTLTDGSKVRLPVAAFGAGTNGGLRVSMTAAQLSAAGAASGTPAPAGDTTTGATSGSSGGQ